MQLVHHNPRNITIAQFQKDFLALLKDKHQTYRDNINFDNDTLPFASGFIFFKKIDEDHLVVCLSHQSKLHHRYKMTLHADPSHFNEVELTDLPKDIATTDLCDVEDLYNKMKDIITDAPFKHEVNLHFDMTNTEADSIKKLSEEHNLTESEVLRVIVLSILDREPNTSMDFTDMIQHAEHVTQKYSDNEH